MSDKEYALQKLMHLQDSIKSTDGKDKYAKMKAYVGQVIEEHKADMKPVAEGSASLENISSEFDALWSNLDPNSYLGMKVNNAKEALLNKDIDELEDSQILLPAPGNETKHNALIQQAMAALHKPDVAAAESAASIDDKFENLKDSLADPDSYAGYKLGHIKEKLDASDLEGLKNQSFTSNGSEEEDAVMALHDDAVKHLTEKLKKPAPEAAPAEAPKTNGGGQISAATHKLGEKVTLYGYGNSVEKIKALGDDLPALKELEGKTHGNVNEYIKAVISDLEGGKPAAQSDPVHNEIDKAVANAPDEFKEYAEYSLEKIKEVYEAGDVQGLTDQIEFHPESAIGKALNDHVKKLITKLKDKKTEAAATSSMELPEDVKALGEKVSALSQYYATKVSQIKHYGADVEAIEALKDATQAPADSPFGKYVDAVIEHHLKNTDSTGAAPAPAEAGNIHTDIEKTVDGAWSGHKKGATIALNNMKAAFEKGDAAAIEKTKFDSPNGFVAEALNEHADKLIAELAKKAPATEEAAGTYGHAEFSEGLKKQGQALGPEHQAMVKDINEASDPLKAAKSYEYSLKPKSPERLYLEGVISQLQGAPNNPAPLLSNTTKDYGYKLANGSSTNQHYKLLIDAAGSDYDKLKAIKDNNGLTKGAAADYLSSIMGDVTYGKNGKVSKTEAISDKTKTLGEAAAQVGSASAQKVKVIKKMGGELEALQAYKNEHGEHLNTSVSKYLDATIADLGGPPAPASAASPPASSGAAPAKSKPKMSSESKALIDTISQHMPNVVAKNKGVSQAKLDELVPAYLPNGELDAEHIAKIQPIHNPSGMMQKGINEYIEQLKKDAGAGAAPASSSSSYSPSAPEKKAAAKIASAPPKVIHKHEELEDSQGNDVTSVLKASSKSVPGNWYADVTAAHAGDFTHKDKTSNYSSYAEDHAMSNYGDVVQNNLEEAHRVSLKHYQGNGYVGINQALNGEPPQPPGASTKQRIKHIKEACAKSVVPAQLAVYRGLRCDIKDLTGFSDHEHAVGRCFEHKNFASVSRHLATSTKFSENKTMMKFTVPAGTKGVVMPGQNGGEREVVLDSNSMYRIDRIEKGALGHDHVVHCTFLGYRQGTE